MNRKIISVLLILITGIFVLLIYIQQSRQNILTDPYKVIPEDALFFIETESLPVFLNSVSENNGLFNDVISIKGLNIFDEKFKLLQAFMNKNEVTEFLQGRKAIISFHYTRKDILSSLLAITVPENFHLHNIESLLKTLPDVNISKEKGKPEILKVYPVLKSVNDTLYICYVPGLIMSGFSKELIEKSIKQKKLSTDIRMMPGLSRIIPASGKKEHKFFIIFKNTEKLVSWITRDKDLHFPEIFTKLAECAELDILVNENGYILEGFAESTDSTDLLYKYKSGFADTLNTYKTLPAGVSLFETVIFSEKEIAKRLLNSMESNMASSLLPYIDKEISRAAIELNQPENKKGNIVIFKLNNRDAAEKTIYDKFNLLLKDNNLKEKNYVKYFQPDEQTKIPVLTIPFMNTGNIFSVNSIFCGKDSLLAFSDNFMVTGDSYEAVEKFLYSNILNRTLSNDDYFSEFESTLPSKSSYFFYFIPHTNLDLFSAHLNDSIFSLVKDNLNILKKIRCIGCQLSPSNGMVYITLSLRYTENVIDEAETEWETKLEGSVTGKPFFFVNHNTGATEIVVQDDRNNLYLINAAGRVLWKIPLSERVNGNIYMIDFYANGKNQLFFSGREYLYLIDRNGNYVEKYPVKLRVTAAGPASVFDYENNHDYRIFIPGEDRIIYAYDKYGRVVKGWKPFKTNTPVRTEIKFFRVSGKDYIVVADENSVYFLDRTGNVRFKTTEPVICARGSEMRLDKGVETSLVFSAPDGTVQFVSFDGKVKKITLNHFSFDHTFDFFDIDGDGYGEFIFIDKSKLYLYDHDNTELFVRDFGNENLIGPINFTFSSVDRKIGIYNTITKQIFLVDKRGNDMKGFPVRGYSKFSIGKLSDKGGFHLIVGGNDNFLYNYKLNIEGNN
ncbi:MAG TPA: hypothetical protein PLN06_01080 [Bacteroidales bacterium]|nr:hypothetical protein [Bacteroidales bacterium]HOU95204.1 hypothetical protein [Bacteroidales bacterium]HQG35971.1 hypothetical protein [Bacteroidales bacterium]HQG52965.1 hypothetical protein [Bacteroidales bacterium]HQJ20810.1 hypothetical protein [Bacteroidales bacterium]